MLTQACPTWLLLQVYLTPCAALTQANPDLIIVRRCLPGRLLLQDRIPDRKLSDIWIVSQDCLNKLKQVLYTENGQPFLVAGSGTLGWYVPSPSHFDMYNS